MSQTWFTGIGSCVWCEGIESAILIWVGIGLCSPILAMLAFFGGLIGSLTMIAIDSPTSTVYNARESPFPFPRARRELD